MWSVSIQRKFGTRYIWAAPLDITSIWVGAGFFGQILSLCWQKWHDVNESDGLVSIIRPLEQSMGVIELVVEQKVIVIRWGEVGTQDCCDMEGESEIRIEAGETVTSETCMHLYPVLPPSFHFLYSIHIVTSLYSLPLPISAKWLAQNQGLSPR